jgi:hypothetical protein
VRPRRVLFDEPAVEQQVGHLPALAGSRDLSDGGPEFVHEPPSVGVYQDGAVSEQPVLQMLSGDQQPPHQGRFEPFRQQPRRRLGGDLGGLTDGFHGDLGDVGLDKSPA